MSFIYKVRIKLGTQVKTVMSQMKQHIKLELNE